MTIEHLTAETRFASNEWPEAFAMLREIVRYAGTEWVRECMDEIESESVDD